jgi:hypothetical protein
VAEELGEEELEDEAKDGEEGGVEWTGEEEELRRKARCSARCSSNSWCSRSDSRWASRVTRSSSATNSSRARRKILAISSSSSRPSAICVLVLAHVALDRNGVEGPGAGAWNDSTRESSRASRRSSSCTSILRLWCSRVLNFSAELAPKPFLFLFLFLFPFAKVLEGRFEICEIYETNFVLWSFSSSLWPRRRCCGGCRGRGRSWPSSSRW